MVEFRGLIKVKIHIQNVYFCLKCMKVILSKEELDKYYNEQKHRLFINFKNWKIVCLECKSQYDISLVEKIPKYRIICTLLSEAELAPPNNNLILTENELYQYKYDKIKNKLINKKY